MKTIIIATIGSLAALFLLPVVLRVGTIVADMYKQKLEEEPEDGQSTPKD